MLRNYPRWSPLPHGYLGTLATTEWPSLRRGLFSFLTALNSFNAQSLVQTILGAPRPHRTSYSLSQNTPTSPAPLSQHGRHSNSPFSASFPYLCALFCLFWPPAPRSSPPATLLTYGTFTPSL